METTWQIIGQKWTKMDEKIKKSKIIAPLICKS
jgi:hypothetical protein